MINYEKERQNQETALQNELNALKCEFENLCEELEITKEKNENLQANLNEANNKIRSLKGQIKAYKHVINKITIEGT